MGTYAKGILGAFSGKVGPVVGAKWKGLDVLRSVPKKSNRIATASQLLQREKFGVVTAFLTPFNPLLRMYYGYSTNDRTQVNQALSYHLKHAVENVAGEWELLFNKVLLSKGSLLQPQAPAVTPTAGRQIAVDWTDNSGQGQALATDKLVVAVYEPSSHLYETHMAAGTRGDGTATVTLSPLFTGLEVHCWILMASDNNKLYSTSNYMGLVQLV